MSHTGMHVPAKEAASPLFGLHLRGELDVCGVVIRRLGVEIRPTHVDDQYLRALLALWVPAMGDVPKRKTAAHVRGGVTEDHPK